MVSGQLSRGRSGIEGNTTRDEIPEIYGSPAYGRLYGPSARELIYDLTAFGPTYPSYGTDS